MSRTQIDATLVPSVQPNILDNGGMEIWQKATSISAPADGTWPFDRWRASVSQAANVTLSRESTVIDSVGQYSAKLVVTSSSGSNNWYLQEGIENYKDYQGQTLTVSVRVNANTANAIRVRIIDGTNTGTSAFHPGDGAWHTLSASITVVSPNNFGLYVQIGMIVVGDKKDGTYYFDSAMLSVSNSVPTFIPTSHAVDFYRCQRFYEAGNVQSNVITLRPGSGSGDSIWDNIQFSTAKQAAPTITLTLNALVLSQLGSESGGDSTDTGAWTTSVNNAYVSGARIQFSRATDGGFKGALIDYNWTAEIDI